MINGLAKTRPISHPKPSGTCHIDLPEYGSGQSEIWLRYYADEKTREDWALRFPEDSLPPHERPPFDRDRFLPTAPFPLDLHSGELPGDGPTFDENDGSDPEPDPLGLATVDREIAAAKTDTFDETGQEEPVSSELEQQLRATDIENWSPPARQLAEQNVPLLPPDELTNGTVAPVLWKLLHNLAFRGSYVLHNNRSRRSGTLRGTLDPRLAGPGLLARP